jgi:hypothetical protein
VKLYLFFISSLFKEAFSMAKTVVSNERVIYER